MRSPLLERVPATVRLYCTGEYARACVCVCVFVCMQGAHVHLYVFIINVIAYSWVTPIRFLNTGISIASSAPLPPK